MTAPETDALEALAHDVRHLMDRQAIRDCIAAHARGHDRHDADLLAACYHPDGIDEHGPDINPGPAYAEWANAVHARSLVNMHNVTTHTCEIDGDRAWAESYCLVALLREDTRTVTLLNGRYVDELERRDGAWRILKRRTTLDLACAADASLLWSAPQMQGYVRGERSRDDISYQRPVRIGGDDARW